MARLTPSNKDLAVEQRTSTDPASWPARRGDTWAELQPLLDRLFLPFEEWIAERVAAHGARDILDIGCGAGATTLAIARRLGPGARCTGIDISPALTAIARCRATAARLDHVEFVTGDAQRHNFGRRHHDAVVSRFGIMFFDDPVVAFARIAGAVRPGGTLECAVWRSAADNPFMATAERVIAPIAGGDTPSDPHAPGQFAFADARRVAAILEASGWTEIDIQPFALPCTMTVAELSLYIRRMGRAGMVLPTLDAPARRDAEARLDAAFAPFVTDGMARFDAACWSVRARTP
ncbi:class I SAM-dependent methyltransferase [Sphingomonas adhaesiva]|uniref:class I SAM-dependent methyltransferase n=1 Tax=Sphingomonas adhaesiva TaxID=28212 RepID=UPI002FFB0A58